MLVQLIGMSILSTLFAVIYRLSAAYGKHELLTTVPGIFGIAATQVSVHVCNLSKCPCQVLLVSPASAMIGVAVFNAIEHQGEMVQEALSAYPELVPIFEENRCGVSTTKNNPIMVAAIVLAIVGMMAHVATCVICLCLSVRRLRMQRHVFSTRSYVIHMQLVVALAVQVCPYQV